MQSKAKTVEQYLSELTEDRRVAIEAVREVIFEDLALDVIAEAIKRVPAKKFIAHCESASTTVTSRASKRKRTTRTSTNSARSAKSAKADKAAKKRPPAAI